MCLLLQWNSSVCNSKHIKNIYIYNGKAVTLICTQISRPKYSTYTVPTQTPCYSFGIYEGRSEINASYFIMLAHDVRGEYC